jgi:hypothetical protein
MLGRNVDDFLILREMAIISSENSSRDAFFRWQYSTRVEIWHRLWDLTVRGVGGVCFPVQGKDRSCSPAWELGFSPHKAETDPIFQHGIACGGKSRRSVMAITSIKSILQTVVRWTELLRLIP